MMWHVVKFIRENVVEAVPNSWYVPVSSECFWPPSGIKSFKILKLIENSDKPSEDWKVHPVKLLGTYEDYHQAQRKAEKAKNTSDISSSNEVQKQCRRKIKRNPKYYQQTDDESCSDSDHTVYPVLRQSVFDNSVTLTAPLRKNRSRSFSPTSRKKVTEDILEKELPTHIHSYGKRSRSLSPTEIIQSRRSMQSINLQIKEPDTKGNPQTSAHTEHVDVHSDGGQNFSDIEFKRIVLRELSKLNVQIASIQDTLATILNIQNMNSLSNSVQATAASISEVKKLNDSLPVRSLEDLEALETWLGQEKYYNLTVLEFRRIGGQSAAQHTRKILYRAISNEVSMLFSWDGHKQKRTFKNFQLARSILDAVKMQYPAILESDVISVIKIWLVKAKERAGGKKAD